MQRGHQTLPTLHGQMAILRLTGPFSLPSFETLMLAMRNSAFPLALFTANDSTGANIRDILTQFPSVDGGTAEPRFDDILRDRP